MKNEDPDKGSDPSEGKVRPRWTVRLIRRASIFNFVLVVAFLILLFGVSEWWWLGAFATYGPRVFVLIPVLILLPISLFLDRWSLLWNSLAFLLIALVAMEFNFPYGATSRSEDDLSAFRVVTCNVQRFEPDFASVLAEIKRKQPDLVAFQEARGVKRDKVDLAAEFPDWYTASMGEFWIACRHPVSNAKLLRTSSFNRYSILAAEIDHPNGSFVVFNVHPRTVRHGMEKLIQEDKGKEEFDASLDEFSDYQKGRRSEHQEMRKFVEEFRKDRPVLIMGDFNTPVSSRLFEEFWGGFTDAFSASGWGFGFTAPCRQTGKMPAGWPWIRIDHILVDDNWGVIDARAGKGNGSDHRLMVADIFRRSSTH